MQHTQPVPLLATGNAHSLSDCWLQLDRVQNEAMRVILGTTMVTPTETMRFMLGLPPMQTRQKVEHVKSQFSAVENAHNPVHEAVKRHEGMQTGTGQVFDGSSIGLITASMPADRTQTNKGVGKVLKPFQASLGDTPARKPGKALSRVASRQNRVIQENSKCKPQDPTGGSVTKDQSVWGFTVKQGATTNHEDSAAYAVSTSS